MPGPEAEADQPAGEAGEDRPARDISHEGGRAGALRIVALALSPVAPHHRLELLRRLGGKPEARLDGGEVPVADQEIGVLLEHRDRDAGPGEQEAQHQAGRTGSDDRAADFICIDTDTAAHEIAIAICPVSVGHMAVGFAGILNRAGISGG